MNKLRIATRGSALALWQSKYIQNLIENNTEVEVELQSMKTKGDVILDTPLAKIGGKGLFTKELEESMLRGESDLAVHSLKDVPVVFPKGLILTAISEREDVRDSFVSEKFASFNELPKGAKVGTTSLRRKMQLLIKRPDLKIISLRGNINTRLRKLKENEFDAIILASAGLKRLNLMENIKYFVPFSLDEMIPAMGQGALGIECVDKSEVIEILKFINNENSVIATTIERDFVAKLNGGCQVPIGVNAEISGDIIKVRAIVGLPDGSEFIKDKREISKADFKNFGTKLADEFISRGAIELLKRAEEMA
ncbi:hydroxymethylbilane synthase [Campylobacter hominis]|uniref:Porphobilinogen deaminase n=1 Tax=Campylobacter hominis (strain ATCC BAA-381 / DSM 21671 / CCUG 45161 / LMG 19568 / NCTC 13146 / CH001A) TaxID=360107 RepID=HEM3_CAMHC|nr:hydroxymethylbilane synthase [Campylobacter hominis]A7I1S0.1 RecName: Full=Porphobilinogen deaminase; Short=PBG; AltName: Full=Hydroxymethylbilane synthase; Short=HMBS; AltName: Full=Pre-uroporphyrinogen synthase [Campylobacter hominis ATCC BAA-381]ABS51146.1 porphobilinogen deaminase [Campylobacter hominis ATCC BAA-381]UAK86250.1 hydroxymethylbilane synthase [Campylobacter hominis]SUW84997.1 porphobilinogen deaminase [Campylobacter hominis]